MAATISVASAKGGVSKTTLSLLVACELALEGYHCVLLDADINQHCVAFRAKSELERFEVVPNVDEGNVLAALRKAGETADVVIVDLPGGSSTLALKALQRSNFVIIPTQKSLLDARDSMKTLAQVDDAQDLARAEIPRSLIWTRIESQIESRPDRHIRESLEAQGLTIFRTGLLNRAAFRAMHISGRVPRQDDPTGGPAENVTAITAELLERLADIQAKAA